MISVHGKKDDYAIMKQVQQIKLKYPGTKIGPLDANADFSQLGPDEILFLVSHGDRLTGDLNDIDRPDLLAWLTNSGRGVPLKFGGIVICACHTGLDLGGLHAKSLAYDIAVGLKGKAAGGTTVAGANGYSFGTPEFTKSGRSSVLRKELRDFYTFAEDRMVKAWPTVNPTRAGGVLEAKWNIQVRTDKTIQENLDASQVPRITPDDVKALLAGFAKEGKQLEDQLKAAITQVDGDSVATRAEALVTGSTSAVQAWNQAIARQYELYQEYYLWAPQQAAFTVVPVPAA
jgi:hypothetical protein